MSVRPKILVVDDRPNMLRLVRKIFQADGDVLTVGGGRDALELLERKSVSIVICDLKMGDVGGLEVLAACRELQPTAAFVLMTAYASVATAIEAMRMGAYDYVTKPFEPEDLRAIVLRALGRAGAHGLAEPGGEVLPGTFGRSQAFVEVAALVRRLAPTDATALILGETGTGKERIARALHSLSKRARGRFVAINCAAIPGELLEAELFGHVKGAFTGAVRNRAGLLEEAREGTLFLDEIGDMKMSLQAKLTRVLEERSVRRIGDSHELAVDVRVIAATHRDIPRMVADGIFREDLWYRLNVAQIPLPPLRERPEDIELLARRFLADEAEKRPNGPRTFTPAALRLLQACAWPGNVRQLKAAIERASIVTDSEFIDLGDLPRELLDKFGESEGDTDLTWHQAMDRARDRAAKPYLRMVLAGAKGNVAAAARQAGVERESFYRLLRRHGVRPKDFRDDNK